MSTHVNCGCVRSCRCAAAVVPSNTQTAHPQGVRSQHQPPSRIQPTARTQLSQSHQTPPQLHIGPAAPLHSQGHQHTPVPNGPLPPQPPTVPCRSTERIHTAPGTHTAACVLETGHGDAMLATISQSGFRTLNPSSGSMPEQAARSPTHRSETQFQEDSAQTIKYVEFNATPHHAFRRQRLPRLV